MMKRNYMIESPTLALRPGEWSEYLENEPELAPHQYYAVALVETPDAPGEAHPECGSLAVIAMQRYRCIAGERAGETLWGWIHLVPDTKCLIGSDLVEGGALPGRWYYLIPSWEASDDAEPA